MELKKESITLPPIRPIRRIRTVFVSLPDEPALRRFYEAHLSKAIMERYERLRAVSYLRLRLGRWMPQLERDISYCNAVIAFVKGNNPNVMLEVGRAMALGKPIVALAPTEMRLPSMLSHDQVIKYSGKVPGEEVIGLIMEAIELAVFTVLQRERSDERTAIQKRLLLGSKQKRLMVDSKLLSGKRAGHREIPKKRRLEEESLAKARRLYRSAHFDTAARVLSQCLANKLYDEEIFHLLADTFFLMGEAALDEGKARKCYEDLLRVSEQGLAICPGSFLLRKDRGLGLIKLGRFSDAEAQFNQLLEEQDFSILHYDLACINALMGNKIKALSHLERSIQMESYYQELARIDPDFDPIWEDVMFQALIFQYRVS